MPFGAVHGTPRGPSLRLVPCAGPPGTDGRPAGILVVYAAPA